MNRVALIVTLSIIAVAGITILILWLTGVLFKKSTSDTGQFPNSKSKSNTFMLDPRNGPVYENYALAEEQDIVDDLSFSSGNETRLQELGIDASGLKTEFIDLIYPDKPDDLDSFLAKLELTKTTTFAEETSDDTTKTKNLGKLMNEMFKTKLTETDLTAPMIMILTHIFEKKGTVSASNIHPELTYEPHCLPPTEPVKLVVKDGGAGYKVDDIVDIIADAGDTADATSDAFGARAKVSQVSDDGNGVVEDVVYLDPGYNYKAKEGAATSVLKDLQGNPISSGNGLTLTIPASPDPASVCNGDTFAGLNITVGGVQKIYHTKEEMVAILSDKDYMESVFNTLIEKPPPQ